MPRCTDDTHLGVAGAESCLMSSIRYCSRDSADRGQRGLATLPPRGRPPAPPSGATPPLRGFRSPGPSGEGHRAPARGVDVKPPSPERSPGVPGLARAPGEPRTPSRGPGGSGRPPRPLRGPWNPSPGSRGGWFYINPSRRGPVPGRGTPPGVRDCPGTGVPWRPNPPRTGANGDPSGVERGRPRAGCLDMLYADAKMYR